MRGWRPSEPTEFNGMIRLVILRCYLDLMASNPMIEQFQMRTNEKHLMEEIDSLKESKKPEDKRAGLICEQAIKRGLKDSIRCPMQTLLLGLEISSMLCL